MPQIAKCGTQIFSLTHREIKDKYTPSKLAFVKSWKGLVLRFGTDTHTPKGRLVPNHRRWRGKGRLERGWDETVVHHVHQCRRSRAGDITRSSSKDGNTPLAELHRSPLQKQMKTFLLPTIASAQRWMLSGGDLCKHCRSVARSWSSPSFFPSMILEHQLEAQGTASTPGTSREALKLTGSLQSPYCPRDRQE